MHLIQIDADIEIDPADVVSTVQADKDIVCGIIRRRRSTGRGFKIYAGPWVRWNHTGTHVFGNRGAGGPDATQRP
jgi:hypothetical protein